MPTSLRAGRGVRARAVTVMNAPLLFSPQVVRFTTDTESVGRVVVTRAQELKADAVVRNSPPSLTPHNTHTYTAQALVAFTRQ